MKRNTSLIVFLLPILLVAQELRLTKGTITDDIVVNDSLSETMAIYLPSSFQITKAWPVLFVFDMEGKAKQSLSMFKDAAEQEGYVLVGSNAVNDTLTISQNVLITSRMFNTVVDMIPVLKKRVYTGGFSSGARFASILPTFIKDIEGVISCGAAIGNIEILNNKNPYYFIGIVGREDYNYRAMLVDQKILDKLRFPNQLLIFDGGHKWPNKDHIADAMRIFALHGMAKGMEAKNDSLITKSYNNFLAEANEMFTNDRPILANYRLSTVNRVFNPLLEVDSLKSTLRALKRSNSFRTKNREQNNYFLKETFTKEDYNYYLEEDIITYNYNNLGWWNYQMSELDKIEQSTNLFKRRMGKRLRGYLNALIADNIDLIKSGDKVDFEALNFLYMLKTITEPTDYESYLKVISYSASIEDYGTAMFYLEELLKNGYKNKSELYALENTALFRITPEFNELVRKYLKESRYDLIED
ncbi:alpha/beta hydrolase [Maribacter aestuarii]|uniref:alpha/beta hydrolase n=1 Tax=Maribacter aestuarii TaxID=1130723 RepID=UPI0025A60C9E|nr:alpha/beta hydrolase [Maribacter aestuarii]